MANVIEVVIRAKDDAKGTIDRVNAALRGLEAQGGPLSGVFNKVSSSIQAIGPAGLIAGAGIVAVGGASAVAATKLYDAVKQGAAFSDELNKVSVQTGLTVEEVSRLKFAADQNESSLAALTQSIKFMSKNLFEAQRGGKEQIDTLKALGFEGQEAAGHLGTTSAALLKVADRLKAIPDQGTRTALAMRLLGRGAIEALPLLQQGSEGIRAYGDEADRMGITVSSVAGRLGDDFGDAVAKVNAQVAGLKTRIGEAVLPAMIAFQGEISKTIAELSKFVEENKATIASLADLTGKVFTFTLNFVVKGAEAAVKAFEFFQKFYDPLGLALGKANAEIAAQDKRLAELSHTLFGDVKTSFDAATGGAEQTTKATDEARKAQEAYNVAVERAYLVSSALADRLKTVFGLKPATELIRDFQKALEDAATSAGKIKLPTNAKGETLTAAQSVGQGIVNAQPEIDTTPLERIAPTINEAIDPASDLAAVFERIGISVEAMNERLAATGESVKSVAVLGEALGAAMETAFSEAFNPLYVGIDAVGQAVGNLRGTFDGAFESLSKAITSGHTGFLKLTNVIEGGIRAMHRFVIELGLAIAKALILKAITGFLGIATGGTVRGIDSGTAGGGAFAARGGTIEPQRFVSGGIAPSLSRLVQGGAVAGALGLAAGGSIALPGLASGGTPAPNITNIIRLSVGGAIQGDTKHTSHFVQGGSVAHYVNGGSVAHFAQGGAVSNIAHLATGGGVSNVFTTSNAFHAASGMSIVPGFPQSHDSVPALLAPGEVVLPNVGGKSPSDLLGNLSNMSRDLSALMARQTPVFAGAPGRGPAIGEVHVHAFDADSVRNHVRGGGLDRELARREELGRGL